MFRVMKNLEDKVEECELSGKDKEKDNWRIALKQILHGSSVCGLAGLVAGYIIGGEEAIAYSTSGFAILGGFMGYVSYENR